MRDVSDEEETPTSLASFARQREPQSRKLARKARAESGALTVSESGKQNMRARVSKLERKRTTLKITLVSTEVSKGSRRKRQARAQVYFCDIFHGRMERLIR